MISAFGIEHGEIAKYKRDDDGRTTGIRAKVARASYKIDDKLEGTRISNAARDRQARRGYKHGMTPAPKQKPPKWAAQGTWPATEYSMSRIKGIEHHQKLNDDIADRKAKAASYSGPQ